MFNPVLFEWGGLLLDGAYLLARHSWGEAVQLLTASLNVVPPLSGTLTLAMEVDGTPTGDVFTVEAAPSGVPSMVQDTLALNRAMNPGEEVRWKIGFDGPYEMAGYKASITIQVDEAE